MSKSSELRALYERIEIDSTDGHILLSNVKSGSASKEEIDELLDIVSASNNGGKILDEIKAYENNLISEIELHLDALEVINDEYLEVAHLDDESEKDLLIAEAKKRYKSLVAKAEEILDAIKIAYFQVSDFGKYDNRLYDVREELAFLE